MSKQIFPAGFSVLLPCNTKVGQLAPMLRFHLEDVGMGSVYFLKRSRNRGKLGKPNSRCSLPYRILEALCGRERLNASLSSIPPPRCAFLSYSLVVDGLSGPYLAYPSSRRGVPLGTWTRLCLRPCTYVCQTMGVEFPFLTPRTRQIVHNYHV